MQKKNKISTKILPLILSAVVISSSVGCSSDVPSDGGRELPKLVIGTDDYAPFTYNDENGNIVGLDIELAEEVCRHLGFEPVFTRIDWSRKTDILNDEKIDCLWCSYSITGREDMYDWTIAYMNGRQVVAVPDGSEIVEIADLADKRVAVQTGTKPEEIFSGRTGGVKLEIPRIKYLNCLPDINYIFSAINEGFVDAIAGQEAVLLEYMKSSTVTLRILEESLLDVEIGVAFKIGTHADVIEKINKTFALLKHNGFMKTHFEKYGLDPDKYMAVDYER